MDELIDTEMGLVEVEQAFAKARAMEMEAAYRVGFREATRYDWNYAADGHEKQLEEAGWRNYCEANNLAHNTGQE